MSLALCRGSNTAHPDRSVWSLQIPLRNEAKLFPGRNEAGHYTGSRDQDWSMQPIEEGFRSLDAEEF